MSGLRRRSVVLLAFGLVAGACSSGGAAATGSRSSQLDPAAAAAASRGDAATTATSRADDEIDLFDATQIRGEPLDKYDLTVGDCFNRVETLRAGRRRDITSKVPCDGPHQYEVFHYLEYDAPHPAIFPGEDAMVDFGLNECYLRFESFVGEIFELSRYDIGVFIPTRDNFEHSRARYRGITCWLHVADFEDTEGSARDSGQ